jgi:phospholipid transport system substrate-binding protein
VALTVVLASVAPATAGAPTERVREFFAGVNRIITDPHAAGPDERLAALRPLVTEIVDFRNAAAVALGSEWPMRSAVERDEFVRLFTDLLETSVFASVGARARIDRGITVAYMGEAKDNDATMVKTTVLTRSGREMSVGYRMAQRKGGWVVQDLVVDGVSLVENYRAQFQKFMQRSSYAGLVGEMRTRIADLGRPTATVSAAVMTPRIVPAAPSIAVVPAPAPNAVREVVVMAAVTPREARPAEIHVPDVRALEPPRPAVRVGYWVQVGAFRNAEKAMRVATALRDQTVSLFTEPDNPLLRVAVGPFANRDAAATKLREIRALGYDAFIAED